MKRIPPLQKRPLRTLLLLLLTVLCIFALWLFAGMPATSPEWIARENEQISFLEGGTVLTTIQQDDYAYKLLRGTDGLVRFSETKRYKYFPFLHEQISAGLVSCEALDGAAYFAAPQTPTEFAYLVVEDEQAAKVVMDVTFTIDDREHAQPMYGVLMENGVFRLDLNEMLNLAQGKVYDSGDRMTYDRTLYWLAFPGNNGLRVFDSYIIRTFDAEGNELNCWTS